MAKSERVREDIYLVQVPIRAGWFASVAIMSKATASSRSGLPASINQGSVIA